MIEIDQLKQQVEQRLLALESLAGARRQVEPVADGRPAAQKAIGRLLRAGANLLDQPTFGTTEQTTLTRLFESIQAWASAATFAAAYQGAVLDRRQSNEIPDQAAIEALAETPFRDELKRVFGLLPTEQAVTTPASPADLKESDQKIAQLALLWRERDQPWAADLAAASLAGRSLDELFGVVDRGFWAKLHDIADGFAIENVTGSQGQLQTQQIVEMNLMPPQGVERGRVQFHPLRVRWRVQAAGRDAVTAETDGLTLVQSFPSAGKVSVQATLSWAGEEISIPKALELTVEENPDYRKRWVFSREWPEWVAVGGAALFAVATAMSTMYGPTFGTYTHYLALFIWAAGAGTGGNVFSQLGTTSAPGGRTDATLKP